MSGDYVVVISQNSPIDKLSKRIIKDIYLKKRLFYNNQKLVPINLSAQNKIRMLFEKNVLNMQREDINNYWIEEHYHGVSPPITQKSDKSLKLFIKNVEGSLGYIEKNKIDNSIKVIYEF